MRDVGGQAHMYAITVSEVRRWCRGRCCVGSDSGAVWPGYRGTCLRLLLRRTEVELG
jgi:hypothetical protein